MCLGVITCPGPRSIFVKMLTAKTRHHILPFIQCNICVLNVREIDTIYNYSFPQGIDLLHVTAVHIYGSLSSFFKWCNQPLYKFNILCRHWYWKAWVGFLTSKKVNCNYISIFSRNVDNFIVVILWCCLLPLCIIYRRRSGGIEQGTTLSRQRCAMPQGTGKPCNRDQYVR